MKIKPFLFVIGFISAICHAEFVPEVSTDIATDKFGRKWVTAFDGLYRFDGVVWRRFDATSTPRISMDSSYKALIALPDGLIVGTENDGAYKINFSGRPLASYASGRRINNLIQIANTVYIGTDAGLFTTDLINNKSNEYLSSKEIKGVTNNFKKIYVATSNEIFSSQVSEGYLKFTLVYEAKEKILRVISYQGFLIVSTSNGIKILSAEMKVLGHFFKGMTISAMEVADNYLWLGGYNKLLKFDLNKKQEVPHEYATHSFGRVFNINYDEEGELWVASENFLVRVSRAPLAFKKTQKQIIFLAKGPADLIYEVIENKGVRIIRTNSDGDYSQFISQEVFQNKIIFYVHFGFDHLWVASREGLLKFDAFGNYKAVYNLSSGHLSSNSILFVKSYDDEHLVIGTPSSGFDLFNVNKQSSINISSFHKEGDNVGEVLYVENTADNGLWVSTSLGIHKLDLHYNSQAFFKLSDFITKYVDVVEYGDSLFVATNKVGLLELDVKNLALKNHITTAHGLLENKINRLTLYDHKLFVGTTSGIQAINLLNRKIEYKQKFKSQPFMRNSFVINSQGNLYFASNDVTSGQSIYKKAQGNERTIITNIDSNRGELPLKPFLTLFEDIEWIEVTAINQSLYNNGHSNCTVEINNNKQYNIENNTYRMYIHWFIWGDYDLHFRCQNESGELTKNSAHITINIPIQSDLAYLFLILFIVITMIAFIFVVKKLRLYQFNRLGYKDKQMLHWRSIAKELKEIDICIQTKRNAVSLQELAFYLDVLQRKNKKYLSNFKEKISQDNCFSQNHIVDIFRSIKYLTAINMIDSKMPIYHHLISSLKLLSDDLETNNLAFNTYIDRFYLPVSEKDFEQVLLNTKSFIDEHTSANTQISCQGCGINFTAFSQVCRILYSGSLIIRQHSEPRLIAITIQEREEFFELTIYDEIPVFDE